MPLLLEVMLTKPVCQAFRPLRPELLGQVHEIGGHDLECRVRREIGHVVRTVLQRTGDEGGLHALRLCCTQVFLVGGDQHHLVGL